MRQRSLVSGSAADGGGIPAKGQWRGRKKAQRVVQLFGGPGLVRVSVLWTLQALGMLGGIVMSGVALWAIGHYLTIRGVRR